MKNLLITILFIVSITLLTAQPVIAVIDFDSGNLITDQNATSMTNIFRSELTRTGRVSVVDRRNVDVIVDELRFQMTDWVNPSKVKQIGMQLGADYLMTGKCGSLGDNFFVMVDMLDIETGRTVHSNRLNLVTWDEYDRKVRGIAEEFIQKLPSDNIFSGTWTTDIMHGDRIDNYQLTFSGANRVVVKITAFLQGFEAVAEGQGTYSYDGNILKINAIMRDSKIPDINNIQWSSVIAFAPGNNSFNMMVKETSKSTKQVRVTFTR